MARSDDEIWFEKLTGVEATEEGAERARIDALRKAVLDSAPGDADELSQRRGRERFLDAVRAESPSEPNEPETEQPWWRAVAAVAVLGVAGLFAISLQESVEPPPWTQDGIRGALEPAQVLRADPEEASAVLVAELESLGVTAERYEYKGAWIVESEVLGPSVAAVEVVLMDYGVSLSPDGRLLLSFQVPDE